VGRNELSGHFAEQELSFGARLFWVAECIHHDITNSISTFPIGNVGVFVVDIKYIHQVTAEADEFWWEM